MGLIKDDRQREITRKLLEGQRWVVSKLRAKYRGLHRRMFTSGPLGFIQQLEGELREYDWLKKATPARVMRRHRRVSLKNLGPLLARLRIASKLTQTELSRRIGCKRRELARIEEGDYQGQSAESFRAAAEALGVEIVVDARIPAL